MKKERAVRVLAAVLLIPLLLTACFYPGDGNTGSKAAISEHIMLVQHAVDLYLDKTSVLPIKNKPEYTPIYEQYMIDFKQLTERNYLSSIPANAFEKGGSDIYVLINAETKPEVKLLDLVSLQQVNDIQRKVEEYMRRNPGQIPSGEQAGPNFYWLDYKKIGEKPQTVRSIYSHQILNLIISEAGRVAIDYAPDLMQLISRNHLQDTDPAVDLRTLLVDESFYVPAASFPYYMINGEPVISMR